MVKLSGGRECTCGKRGCAETIVSGPGLVATMRAMHGREMTPDEIVAAARSGDDDSSAVIALLATSLGHIAAVAAAVVNPDTIIIGGGLGVAAFDLIAADAEREIYRRISPIQSGTIQFRPATLASSAIGAASIVWSRAEGRTC
jgi:predicted NBD/HSP70 family sugar kinase